MGANALAVVEGGNREQADDPFTLMQRQARLLVASGLLPSEITTPEKATAVMMKARELGIPPMYGLSNIVIVKGKPTCSAELMLALIRRRYGQRIIRIKASTDLSCTVEWRQDGWDGTQTYTWTIEQARNAGLAGGDNWRHYPAAMLRARTISQVARMAFPECIAGMYTPDELGVAVQMTDDGEGFGLPAMPPPAPMIAVQGGTLDETTGEYTPLPEVDSPIGVASTPGVPPPGTAAHQERDNLDEVAPHDYRQRLYTNSRDLLHPALHNLALHFWPHLGSTTEMTFRQVDHLLHWINATEPATFEETLDLAIEAGIRRDAAAAEAETDLAPSAISEAEAQQFNWRDQIEAACAEPTNLQAWRDLVLQAGQEEWRWGQLMALAPSKEKLGSLHTYAGKAKALTDAVKAAHNERLAALQARIDHHTS